MATLELIPTDEELLTRLESPGADRYDLLLELQKRGVAIDAIALRDDPQDVLEFLAKYGDPFSAIGSDPIGEAQIAFGSSGVPESFIVDGKGVIVKQHVGDIRPEQVPELIAAVRAAR